MLGTLVLFRIVLPLAVLARSGSPVLPGLPAYVYDPLAGDAHGYHAAMRELLATPLRLGPALPGVVLALVGLAAVAYRWPSARGRRPALALVAVWCVSAIATLFVLRMRYSGAVTIGWPLVWSLPLLPYRALGLPLTPDIAFGFGLVLSLLANAVSIVGTYLLGLWSTGRQSVGLVAASLIGLWPLLLPVLGETADVGTWQVDLGLAMYSEPLSTALVVSACALIVRRSGDLVVPVIAGALLGLAVTVRLSNAVIVLCIVALVALGSGRRAAVPTAAGAIAFLPVVLAYWPLGYAMLPPGQFPDDAFAVRHAADAWSDSILWGARAGLFLIPLAAVGAAVVPRLWAALFASWVLSTAFFYTFYSFTPLHPRFLLVALPALSVLWSAGLVALLGRRYGSFSRRP